MSSDKNARSLRDDMSNPQGWGYGSNVQSNKSTGEKDALLLEVFPQEANTDLGLLEREIRGLSIPGVRWGDQFAVEDVAFGIKKLKCMAVIDGFKQETQSIQDSISRCKGVKSCEFVAFTKC